MPDLDIDIPIYPLITNGEIKLNGQVLSGVAEIEVSKTAGDSAGQFSMTVQNIQGVNNETFSIDDDVEVYFPDESSVSMLVLKGFVDSIDNSQFGKIVLKGQDYTAKLQKVIMNEVFVDAEVSEIITTPSTGVGAYVAEFGITTNNVQVTTTTLDAFKISQKSAWEVMKELADQANYAFYVDTDKDLHFEPKSDVSSGVTLSSGAGGNVSSYNFLNDYKQSFNKVTVFGTEQFVRGQLSGSNYPTDTFDGTGSKTAFVLSHTPSEPVLEVKVGGVAKSEGVDFSVDYALATVNFVTAPASGTGNVTVTYDWVKSVLATATDEASIVQNGLSEKVINDRDITSTDRARKAAEAYLTLYTEPKAVLNVRTRGHTASGVSPAQAVVVNIARANVNSESYNIAQLRYKWGKAGYTCNWTLATIDISLAEVLKELKTDIVELKRRGLTTTIVTEETITAVLEFDSSTVVDLTRDVNSSFIAGVSLAGQHGSVAGDKRTYTFS